ncbi:MAG: lytic transglycosylase domain-containing protein [Pseudomonadota bacterium]
MDRSLVNRPGIGLGIVLLLAGLAGNAVAEVFIYRGPNGERLASDRPLPAAETGYELLTRRDSLHNTGHILASRRVLQTARRDLMGIVAAASRQHQVDARLIEAVIQIESGFNPEAVSDKGATGLMQLMWSTAQRYRVQDRFNPRENIFAGTRHLKYLLERFNGDVVLALAAYNAGAGAVERHQGVPPYPETRRYIDKVLTYHAELQALVPVAD